MSADFAHLHPSDSEDALFKRHVFAITNMYLLVQHSKGRLIRWMWKRNLFTPRFLYYLFTEYGRMYDLIFVGIYTYVFVSVTDMHQVLCGIVKLPGQPEGRTLFNLFINLLYRVLECVWMLFCLFSFRWSYTCFRFATDTTMSLCGICCLQIFGLLLARKFGFLRGRCSVMCFGTFQFL
jgi:hypothetical protein